MTQLKLTTAVRRRFHASHWYGESDREEHLRTEYMREVPELEQRVRVVEEKLLQLAYQGIELELNFWLDELGRKDQQLSMRTIEQIIRKARSLNADLPEGRRISTLETVLEAAKMRRAFHFARAALDRLRNKTGHTGDNRKAIRIMMRKGRLTLADLGTSEAELNSLSREGNRAQKESGRVISHRQFRPKLY